MEKIAQLMVMLLKHTKPAPAEKGEGLSRAKVEIDKKVLEEVKQGVAELLESFPLYPELVI